MKYGDWQKVSLILKSLPLKQKEVKAYVLDKSAVEFQRGIKAEIIKHGIKPDDVSKFTQFEYADKVEVQKPSSTRTLIGIPKESKIRGNDVGEFAIEAEYGIHGNRFIGIWRNYMKPFERKLLSIVEKMNTETE